jgi:hypothetical protein
VEVRVVIVLSSGEGYLPEIFSIDYTLSMKGDADQGGSKVFENNYY